MNMRVHISLNVKDLETSLKFYENLFGRPPTKVRGDYANFRLDRPAIHLALQPAEDPSKSTPVRTTTHSHFGIELPDRETIDEWHERLRESGVEGRDEHDVVCCYARAEKIWLSDPDQNAWEIWVRTGEAERLHSDENECCAAA